MANTRQTVRELAPAIGEKVLVRFEQIQVRCTVLDAKNSWGQVRLLIAPETGNGEQWIELGRLCRPRNCAMCGEVYEDHRPASGNAPPLCATLASRPGDHFIGEGR